MWSTNAYPSRLVIAALWVQHLVISTLTVLGASHPSTSARSSQHSIQGRLAFVRPSNPSLNSANADRSASNQAIARRALDSLVRTDRSPHAITMSTPRTQLASSTDATPSTQSSLHQLVFDEDPAWYSEFVVDTLGAEFTERVMLRSALPQDMAAHIEEHAKAVKLAALWKEGQNDEQNNANHNEDSSTSNEVSDEKNQSTPEIQSVTASNTSTTASVDTNSSVMENPAGGDESESQDAITAKAGASNELGTVSDLITLVSVELNEEKGNAESDPDNEGKDKDKTMSEAKAKAGRSSGSQPQPSVSSTLTTGNDQAKEASQILSDNSAGASHDENMFANLVDSTQSSDQLATLLEELRDQRVEVKAILDAVDDAGVEAKSEVTMDKHDGHVGDTDGQKENARIATKADRQSPTNAELVLAEEATADNANSTALTATSIDTSISKTGISNIEERTAAVRTESPKSANAQEDARTEDLAPTASASVMLGAKTAVKTPPPTTASTSKPSTVEIGEQDADQKSKANQQVSQQGNDKVVPDDTDAKHTVTDVVSKNATASPSASTSAAKTINTVQAIKAVKTKTSKVIDSDATDTVPVSDEASAEAVMLYVDVGDRLQSIPVANMTELGYRADELLEMECDAVAVVISDGIKRPRFGVPTQWKIPRDKLDSVPMERRIRIVSADQVKTLMQEYTTTEERRRQSVRAKSTGNKRENISASSSPSAVSESQQVSRSSLRDDDEDDVYDVQRYRDLETQRNADEDGDAAAASKWSPNANSRMGKKGESDRKAQSEDDGVASRRSNKQGINADNDATRQRRRERNAAPSNRWQDRDGRGERQSGGPKRRIYNARQQRVYRDSDVEEGMDDKSDNRSGRARRQRPSRISEVDTSSDPPKPENFWPGMDSFRSLLKSEEDLRLRILGRDWADTVRQEGQWRTNLYKKWLWTLNNGIGDSLVVPPSRYELERRDQRRQKKKEQEQPSWRQREPRSGEARDRPRQRLRKQQPPPSGQRRRRRLEQEDGRSPQRDERADAPPTARRPRPSSKPGPRQARRPRSDSKGGREPDEPRRRSPPRQGGGGGREE